MDKYYLEDTQKGLGILPETVNRVKMGKGEEKKDYSLSLSWLNDF